MYNNVQNEIEQVYRERGGVKTFSAYMSANGSYENLNFISPVIFDF